MLKTRHILLIFLPAILIASFALFIQIIQYRSGTEAKKTETLDVQIPVFAEDPILGEKKAGITLVAFEDFGCPACKDQSAMFDELLKKYPGKIKIIWKGLPVARFPFSTRRAHEYAFCANRQGKFSAFKEFAFANMDQLSQDTLKAIQGEMALDEKKISECLSSGEAEAYIQKIEQLAFSLQIEAVPAVFLNGSPIEPPRRVEGWETMLKL